MKKIVVIGATGMMGKPVARELIKAGYDVTLAVRDIKKARKIFPLANLVEADVFQLESLQKVLKGKDIVYINLHTSPDCKPSDRLTEKDGIENIITAAKESGIQRIAMLSSLVIRYNGMNGFRWWLFSIKQLAVDRVMKSGIPFTIFYASSFMESLDQLMLKGNLLLLAGKSKVPMWMLAGEDFGRQVAWSFQKLVTENREYVMQGPEAFTWQQAAEIFKDNYTVNKIRIVKSPLPLLELAGNFNRAAKYNFKIGTALNNYPEKYDSQLTWEELGKPLVTLDEYAKGLSKKRLVEKLG